jgi:SAM-dependent methyltransferase
MTATTIQADQLARLWDASAQAYDQHTHRYPTHRQITSLLVSNFPGTPNGVLDFGCGPGNSSRALRGWFPHARLVGLDISQPMIDIAERTTPSDAKIEYRCQSLAAYLNKGQTQDLIVCSNSFFHAVDQHALVNGLAEALAAGGRVVFSLYDTVFRPDNTWRWPLDWPTIGIRRDPLMAELITGLRRKGYDVASRGEDRPVHTEETLGALFADHGLVVRCTGMLRLFRSTQERVSFFRIPAIAAENFPTVPVHAVQEVLDELEPPPDLPPRHRAVYAFTAAST